MNKNQLKLLGVPDGPALRLAQEWIRAEAEAGRTANLAGRLGAILADPEAYLQDPEAGTLAREIQSPARQDRLEPAPWHQWGNDIDPAAVDQLANACSLEIAAAGALMPDAHVGYGLPIGGVLATHGAVIPYAVGVDIACRMRLTVFDIPAAKFSGQKDRLANILEEETRFGMGAAFTKKRDHEVMDLDWNVSPITQRHKSKAWSQLGTSGSGNHFVEYGALAIESGELGVPAGNFLALLSHSGSRGTGAQVCNHYSRLAMERHARLPKHLLHLAWLDLDSEAGTEYWQAMNLMGNYAAANHQVIHCHIAKRTGGNIVLTIENHHNFAWKETHRIDGREQEVIVHRKGATPAGAGVLGIIPGSMATPGFVVRGRGNPASLNSASHGAGRTMSRRQALNSFVWGNVRRELEDAGVEVLSAGLDEVPGVYKDIHQVMAAQTDLVDVLARFDPKLVKMSPPGEKAED